MVGQVSPGARPQREGIPEALADARDAIDAIDDQIVDLLVQRLAVVKNVVIVKEREGIPALLPDRVEEVVERVGLRAAAAGLPPDLTERVWRDLIEWTIAYEDKHLGAPNSGE